MDKIPLQTVYVPVAVTRYDFTGKPSVPMISLAGMVSQEYTDKARKKNTWRILDQQDNRIILTPQELNDLLLEYHSRMVNDPKAFLKSKGIEL